MDARLDEYMDALGMMNAAMRLLQQGDCPFDVAAHLDFAAHRLGDHLAVKGFPVGAVMAGGPLHWLN